MGDGKNRLLQAIVGALIFISLFCLLAKSFIVIHRYRDDPTVMVMMKTDPFAENSTSLRDEFHEDKASPLLLWMDDNQVIGEETLSAIFKLPLWAYILSSLALLSIGAYLFAEKYRWKAVLTILGPPTIVFTFWLFGTYDPTEKVYSADRQYSFYIEKYNYNRVRPISIFYALDFGFAGVCTPCLYKRKIFLYDEVEKKILTSRYVGDTWSIDYDKSGFYDHDNTVFFTGAGEKYTLPRPIDEKAIELEIKRRKQREVQERREQEERRRFLNFPRISSEDFHPIEPIVTKWLDHHKVEPFHIRFVREEKRCFNCKPNRAEAGIYTIEFTPEHDSSDRLEMAYSPNKQRYINLGYCYETINGKNYDGGCQDDSQEVYLTDRRKKHHNLIFWYGLSGRVDAVYWKNDDVFVALGREYDELPKYVMTVFDIAENTIKRYEFLVYLSAEEKQLKMGGYRDVYLEEKGIIPYHRRPR